MIRTFAVKIGSCCRGIARDSIQCTKFYRLLLSPKEIKLSIDSKNDVSSKQAQMTAHISGYKHDLLSECTLQVKIHLAKMWGMKCGVRTVMVAIAVAVQPRFKPRFQNLHTQSSLFVCPPQPPFPPLQNPFAIYSFFIYFYFLFFSFTPSPRILCRSSSVFLRVFVF